MFEAKESMVEKVGKKIGFGIAMVLFVSVFYYILSRFVPVLNLRLYKIVIGSIILIYILWLVLKKLK